MSRAVNKMFFCNQRFKRFSVLIGFGSILVQIKIIYEKREYRRPLLH